MPLEPIMSKQKIDNMRQNTKCKLFGDREVIVNPINECNELAQKEYRRKEDDPLGIV